MKIRIDKPEYMSSVVEFPLEFAIKLYKSEQFELLHDYLYDVIWDFYTGVGFKNPNVYSQLNTWIVYSMKLDSNEKYNKWIEYIHNGNINQYSEFKKRAVRDYEESLKPEYMSRLPEYLIKESKLRCERLLIIPVPTIEYSEIEFLNTLEVNYIRLDETEENLTLIE